MIDFISRPDETTLGRMVPRASQSSLLWMCSLLGILSMEFPMSLAAQPADASAVTLRIVNQPRPISPDLFGIFFEDLNSAADGGLYAELIENRSFDFSAVENPKWNALAGWELVQTNGRGAVSIDEAWPIHPNNPSYAVLEVFEPGDGVGLINDGFDGIAVKAGEHYEASLFARHLFGGNRWGGRSPQDIAPGTLPGDGAPGPIVLRLVSKTGDKLAEASVAMPDKEWTKLTATLTPSRDEPEARLIVLMTAKAGIALDMVSLFPHKTFRDRANGLRADLAQAIADLKPRFVRFPGGCLVHGNGLPNLYHWKNTIGPVESRRGQPNLWRYHQSMGLGYFEYFQFCQDIGAKPLPVVAAGVSCQNSGFTGGSGQRAIPLEEMPAYIQDVLDLIEYANGPATSTWGARRAAAGHPEPFHLEYLGIGNEDHITPAFKERFEMIYNAVKAKHPQITVIGTVGPSHSGEDYEAGWAFAREKRIEFVDEHYYVPPDWFWDNLHYYDNYDRNGAKVYLGEYAAHDRDRKCTLRSALAEAAYLTSLERNGDIVRFASYAPLLGKRGRTQWNPDLIYFDNTRVSPTLSYDVQKLFSHNAGDTQFPIVVDDPSSVRNPDGKTQLAYSCVRDGETLILKIVSRADAPLKLEIDLSAVLESDRAGTVTVLSGDADAVNAFGEAPAILPVTAPLTVGPRVTCEVPARSLSVIRIGD